MSRHSARRPIVCRHEVNCMVGLVLREDYDEASRLFWEPFHLGKSKLDPKSHQARYGRRIPIEHVFVFTSDFASNSPEYLELLSRCFVEQATFKVPEVSEEELNPLSKASAHFFGDSE
jgi:hypothetical protein